MLGCAIWKRPSRGTSQLVQTVLTAVTDSTFSSVSRRLAKATFRRWNASATAGARRLPASDRTTLRGCRRNSGAPTRSSSSFTW